MLAAALAVVLAAALAAVLAAALAAMPAALLAAMLLAAVLAFAPAASCLIKQPTNLLYHYRPDLSRRKHRQKRPTNEKADPGKRPTIGTIFRRRRRRHFRRKN